MKFLNKPGKELVKIGTLVNKQEPTITIITPFYNGGATLEETANTVLGQTYPYFEWIIIDDGSKSSLNLEQEYINPEQFFAFLDEDTIHINKEGMSVADCLKQPGFKVVDDKGD